MDRRNLFLMIPALALTMLSSAVSAQTDAASGQRLFQQRCQACHSVDPAKPAGVGPSLAGVVGRRAASTNFRYSEALKKSGLTWTTANLDKYLASPQKLVPGTRMAVQLSDAKQRQAIIGYLTKPR